MANILFICKWNRFRSKMAEAIFNKLNKNKKHQAKSAGIISGFPIDKELFEVCKKSGYPISKKVQEINYPLIKWCNQIIIIEENIPLNLFRNINYKRNLKKWKIKDVFQDKQRPLVIKQIKRKVKTLIKNLN